MATAYAAVYIFIVLGAYFAWRFLEDHSCESFEFFMLRKVYSGAIFLFSTFMIVNIHLNYKEAHLREIDAEVREYDEKVLAEQLA